MSCIVKLRRALALVMLLVAAAGALAQTEGNADPVFCKGQIADPDVAFQVDLCTAHVGCALVIKAHKTCTAVRGFAERLGNSIGQGVKTLFGHRKEVQPENIWEAVQTENTRRLDDLPEAKARSSEIREALAKKELRTTDKTSRSGGGAVLYGEVKDGQLQGWGMKIGANGTIERGEYRDNKLDGRGEKFLQGANGAGIRAAGEFRSDEMQGDGLVVNASGTLFQGRFQSNGLAEGKLTLRDGSRQEGRFDSASGQLVQGSKYAADGILVEKGTYRDGQLYVGERWAAGALLTSVNRPREQMQLAEAEQAGNAERMRREAAEKAAAEERARQEAAAREQKFRDDLASMNAGQLYALADEAKERRDTEKARQALRALITRFPDHALAATAAAQLSSATVAAAPTARAAPATTTARAGSGSDSCRRALKGAWDKAMARGAAEKVTFFPGVSGRFQIRMYELLMQFLAPCRGEADTDREIENYRSGIEQLKGFCTPERLVRDYPRRDAPGGYAVPDHCRMEYVSPGVERWYAIYQEEVATARQQLAGGGLPESAGCQPDARLMSAYDAAMAGLPAGSPSVQIRGAIVGIDLQLRAARACQAGTSVIAALEQQRAQALRTCQQIVSRDNCLEPPFALPGLR